MPYKKRIYTNKKNKNRKNKTQKKGGIFGIPPIGIKNYLKEKGILKKNPIELKIELKNKEDIKQIITIIEQLPETYKDELPETYKIEFRNIEETIEKIKNHECMEFYYQERGELKNEEDRKIFTQKPHEIFQRIVEVFIRDKLFNMKKKSFYGERTIDVSPLYNVFKIIMYMTGRCYLNKNDINNNNSSPEFILEKDDISILNKYYIPERVQEKLAEEFSPNINNGYSDFYTPRNIIFKEFYDVADKKILNGRKENIKILIKNNKLKKRY